MLNDQTLAHAISCSAITPRRGIFTTMSFESTPHAATAMQRSLQYKTAVVSVFSAGVINSNHILLLQLINNVCIYQFSPSVSRMCDYIISNYLQTTC